MKPFWGIIIFFIGIIMFKVAFLILNYQIEEVGIFFTILPATLACIAYYIKYYLNK